jgi:hypothetical protein
MIGVIQYYSASSCEWTIPALQLGVELKVVVVYLQEPLRESEGIEISHVAYKMRNRNRVWTGIWRLSGFKVDEWTD